MGVIFGNDAHDALDMMNPMLPERTLFRLLFVILVFVALTLGAHIAFSFSQDTGITVAFLDVGQGDSILLSSGNHQVLIDGGADDSVLRERLSDFLPWGDTTIEVVIATHPDADHIGALAGIADAYEIEMVIETLAEKDTAVFRAWQTAKSKHSIRETVAKRGMRILFSNGASLEVLAPEDGGVVSGVDVNDASVVTRLDYGDHSFLFTGDITDAKENELNLSSVDVLKVAHHGSKSSSSQAFLNRVIPQDSVISVGANNRYGHPASEVINRLEAIGSRILRTDEMGSIVYRCISPEMPCDLATYR
jgi:competence protein ComEC